MHLKFLLALSIIYIPYLIESAKILGIFPLIVARSHFIFGNALLKGLVKAGHEVTVISPHEDIDAPITPAYRKIVLREFLARHESIIRVLNLFELCESHFIENHILEQILITEDEIFNSPDIRKLIKSGEKFDVVIVDNYKCEFLKIFADLFDAHLIVLNPTGVSSLINGFGTFNLRPYEHVNSSKILKNVLYFRRIWHLLYYINDLIMTYFFYIPRQSEILKKHFPNSTYIMNMVKNVSLVFSNFHSSLGGPFQTASNLIDVGGIHLQPSRKLSQDLQQFLDNAEEGVIYFSMGSLLNSKYLPENKRSCFIKVFSKLKQKVLWKWDDDILPDQPPNVRIQKWLPQQDVLAHPNINVFVTHGGMLSLTEAVYYGVPMLVIPVFSDQFNHASRAKLNGYGLSLPLADKSFSEEKILELINELLLNSKYKTNIMARSKLFCDRPMKPMETAIYWVEYVVRNKGAPHLKQTDVDLKWIKYLIFEIIFLVSSTLLIIFVLFISVREVRRFKKKGNFNIRIVPKEKNN